VDQTAVESRQRRLQKLGLFDLVAPDHILSDRTKALRQAIDLVYSKEGNCLSCLIAGFMHRGNLNASENWLAFA
jgi:hypothetical protein